jgi:hypothetical protein
LIGKICAEREKINKMKKRRPLVASQDGILTVAIALYSRNF